MPFSMRMPRLPDDVLVFLLGSAIAIPIVWPICVVRFSEHPSGWPRVEAIRDYVHNHIAFDYQKADPLRTAHGGYTERTGVCSDSFSVSP